MTDPQQLLEQGLQLHQFGKLPEAESLYQQVLAQSPNHAGALHLLGVLCHQTGRDIESVTYIEKAIALNPGVAAYHNNLANTLLRLGRVMDAATHYQQAVTLKPDYTDAILNLGTAYMRQGKPADAIPCFERAAAQNPQNLMAYKQLGHAYHLLGQKDNARAAYEKALALASQDAALHYNLGVIAYEQARHDDAARLYRQAIAINPNHVQAHFSLGNVLNDQGEADASIQHFTRYLDLDPTDAHGARMLLARLGSGAVPERASKAHMEQLYQQRAQSWDQGLNTTTSYRGHILVADAFAKAWNRPELPDILDAGCGTGLVGELLKPRSRELHGIDLSQPMLERANPKQIYTRLFQGDMLAFMADRPEQYDAIVSAATLIHFGDLRPVFQAAAIALKPTGLFISTIFVNNHETPENGISVSPYAGLARGGCYTHGEHYLRKTAETSGFRVESLDKQVHEDYDGEPVMAFVAVMEKSV